MAQNDRQAKEKKIDGILGLDPFQQNNATLGEADKNTQRNGIDQEEQRRNGELPTHVVNGTVKKGTGNVSWNLDATLEQKRREADSKKTMKGVTMTRQEWNAYYEQTEFDDPDTEAARLEWLKRKNQEKRIKSLRQPNWQDDQRLSADGNRSRHEKHEKMYRDALRRQNNPTVNAQLDAIEAQEAKSGKMVSSASAVIAAVESDTQKGLAVLDEKFQECTDCPAAQSGSGQ